MMTAEDDTKQKKQQQLPKIYTLEHIERVTSDAAFQESLIDAIGDGFVKLERGEFFAAPIQTLGAPPLGRFGDNNDETNSSSTNSTNDSNSVPPAAYAAQTCVKSGYFGGSPYYVIKVASGGAPFPDNSGLMQVYSQATGRLEALLLDEGLLTELRTAAVGALAARYLAPPPPPSNSIHGAGAAAIGIVGTGVQARYQLEFLKNVTPCRTVYVAGGRSAEKRAAFCNELKQNGWTSVHDVSQASSPSRELLEKCQIIVTTTSARDPILDLPPPPQASNNENGDGDNTTTTWNEQPNCLITCIGSDTPGKQELGRALIQRADVRVADHPAQSRLRGEFQAIAAAEWKEKCEIHALGNVLTNSHLHRRNEKDKNEKRQLIIFDSSGVALQDCVIAEIVYKALLSLPQQQ